MVNRNSHRRLIAAGSVCLLLLLAAGGQAQETQEYRIEVLVLRHLNNEARSFEAPPVVPDVLFGDAASLPPETERILVPYLKVPQADLQLGDAEAQLSRSRDFRPLLRLAWKQQALDADNAGWVPVTGQAEDGTVISGYARLTVSRYLHLRFELEADIPEKGRFRLEESRRMKSGDLHYFDHPEFGALVTIIPEPADEQSDS